MGTRFRQIKVYGKLVISGLVLVYCVLLIVLNWKQPATVHLVVKKFQNVSVLWLVLATGCITLAARWILVRVRGLKRELGEVARIRKAEQEAAQQRQQLKQIDQDAQSLRSRQDEG